MGDFGQWLQDAAGWLTANVISPGTAASQYRDPNEAAKQNAPQTQQTAASADPFLQATLSAMNYVRNNFISRPISDAFLMAGETSEQPLSQQPGFLFNARHWGQAWDAAQHISPGQSIMLDADKKEYTKAVNSPLTYYKPADALLPPGFNQLPVDQQNQALQQAGMPAVGNQFIEQKRQDSTLFKYGSGSLDFLASWELDPAILGGKALGKARNSLEGPRALLPGATATPLVRPIPSLAQRAIGGAVSTVTGGRFGKVTGGWSAQNITDLVNSSRFGNLQDFLWKNKDNPQLINNLQMAQRSAMGPRFGALVSTLQSPEEVNLFMRSGMGDVAARTELETKNAAAMGIIEQNNARLSALGLQRSTNLANPYAVNLIDQRMAQLQGVINANIPMVQRYNQILDHYGELDRLKDNAFTMTNAEFQQAAQNVYRTGAGRPLVNLGIAKSRIASKFFQAPVTVVRSFQNYTPHGFVDLNDVTQDSINEIRGFLARIPNIDPTTRENVVNAYLKAPDEGTRLNVLQDASKMAMGKIAQKYNLLPSFGEALYNEDRARQGLMRDNLRQYATARIAQGGDLKPIRADAFTDTGGGITIHPNLVSRLMNNHILPDLDRYDTVLRRNTSALSALAVKGGDAADLVRAGADYFQQMWKFGTLFRLGYIPRVLGDDLAGQMARLGMASMALRAGYGVKNLATNLSSMMLKPYYQASAETKRIGINYADQEIMDLNGQIAKEEAVHDMYVKAGSKAYNKAQGQLTAAQKQLDLVQAGPAPAQRIQQLQALVDQRQATLAATPVGEGIVPAARVARLADLRLHQGWLTRTRADMQDDMNAAIAAQAKVRQGTQATTINGVVMPGAFQGTRGQYYQKVISPDESLANVFNTNRQLIHGNLMRAWDHGAVQVYAPANEELHGQAWAHVINAHFAQDPAARQVLFDVAGGVPVDASVAKLMDWLKTPAGLGYRDRLGLKMIDDEQIANSIAHDVHEMVPLPGIAQKAMEADGVTPGFLKASIPNPNQRPDAIAPQLGSNFTQMRFNRVVDRVMQHWFDTVATKPANFWSRHPLFNQLYEGHANALIQQEKSQGVVHTVADADRIAETGRRLALKDMRTLVFDIAHKSDAMHALSLIAPFFAATAEGWQRWARIIADRPEVAGYASKFFNVPMSLGMMQNSDGETITPDGQAWDPSQKKMVDVPMSDRYIVARLPKIMRDTWNPVGLITNAGPGGDMKLSQESMNLVIGGDPWFNPGQGPIVTIPVNEFVKDKPDDAQLARQVGILPFGPASAPTVMGRVLEQTLPRTFRDFLTAYDTTDYRYQQVKLQIMQQAAFEHAQFGAAMPTASQIANRVKDYWRFSALSAFLGPVSGQKNDPYAFYRQQYNNLLRNNPQTADQEYLSRYGESHFVFAQSLSKNNSGAAATLAAAALEKKYGDLIAQNPDLAALIIGPNGNGPFSPEAYTYELNNPIVPGGSEMMRTRMSADDAMKENQKRLGWAKYTGVMNGLTATLVSRGLQSFSDKGAEDLKATKRAYVQLLGNPMLPDGSSNPFYNAEWSKNYYSFDSMKYEQVIPGLQAVANSDLAKDPSRTDLRVLQSFLTERQALVGMLNQRKLAGGSEAITAGSNDDLKNAWERVVGGMIEGDVNFGNLYHRYLSRDLGLDAEAGYQAQQAQGA